MASVIIPDINGKTEKTAISFNDIVEIEDSASSYTKKKLSLGNLLNNVGQTNTIVSIPMFDSSTAVTTLTSNFLVVPSDLNSYKLVSLTASVFTKSTFGADNSLQIDVMHCPYSGSPVSMLNAVLNYDVSANKYGYTSNVNTSTYTLATYDIVYVMVTHIPSNPPVGLSVTIEFQK